MSWVGRAAVGAVLLAGLGGAAAPTAAATTSARPVQVSWSQEGHHISVRTGQSVQVRLTGQTCTSTTVPVSSTPVLKQVQAGTNGGNAWTIFTAVSPGTAVITATHGEACGLGGSDFVPEKFTLTVDVH